MDALRELPMFPLGTVLLPHALLPLHVFEPRYRALVDDVLASGSGFGVVLIARGSEVGGGDTRVAVGTHARVVRADRLDDGRSLLAVVGTQRLRVHEWLPDAPYPRARVEMLTEPVESAPAPARADVERQLTRVHALRAELGVPAPGELVIDEDTVVASYQAVAWAMLGPLDAQRVLELEGAAARFALLADLLAEQVELLELRLAAGSP